MEDEIVLNFESSVHRDRFLEDFFPKREYLNDPLNPGLSTTGHPIYKRVAMVTRALGHHGYSLRGNPIMEDEIVLNFESSVHRDRFLEDFFPKREYLNDPLNPGLSTTGHPIYKRVAVYMLRVTLLVGEERRG